MEFPSYHPPVHRTPRGTPYLQKPGVALIMQPQVDLRGVQPFFDNFDSELGFEDYLKDPTPLLATEKLIKFAGQLCYLSFSERRTWNVDCSKYMTNIKASGHGSVLEHPNFSFFCYGISRSLTHELVRHRAGAAYSQLSQRYVDGKALRFVERPEFVDDPELHDQFERDIDHAAGLYAARADRLYQRQLAGDPAMSGEKKTDLRKKVNQAARSVLPNETETMVVVTLNGRSLRHILEMRVSSAAEVEIRRLGYYMFQLAKVVAPVLLEDYTLGVQKDGTPELTTAYRKV